MENENNNLAYGSGSTAIQPPVQPAVQAPVQPVEVAEPAAVYSQSGWKIHELKKVKRTSKKIISNFRVFRSPKQHSHERHLGAVEFFRSEWPHRSPYAVYQKALKIKNARKIFVILKNPRYRA